MSVDKRRRSSPDSPIPDTPINLCKRTRSYSENSVFDSIEENMASSVATQIVEAFTNPELLAKVGEAVANVILPSINKNLETKLSEMNKICQSQEKKIKALQKEVFSLNERMAIKDTQIDELYQYGRRNNVRVHGIPETKGENTDILIQGIANEIGVKLEINDIDRSHRTGDPAKHSETNPRPILVKLMSYRKKREIMTNLSKLKGRTPEVYVNDDLTKERARIAAEIRKLVKEKKLAGQWVRDGIIFAKKHDEEVVLITKRSQLASLLESLRLKLKISLSQEKYRASAYSHVEEDADESEEDYFA